MTLALQIAVRFHDGHYHGEGDGFSGASGWPPSPARLFQALVAGAAKGSAILPADQDALRWLEELPPPLIAAPPTRQGGAAPLFVPNNDLDAVGGDPARLAEIRVAKHWRPHYFDQSNPVLYVWEFEPPDHQAQRICTIANHVYQLGRGVDMAAANGSIVALDVARKNLMDHPGAMRRPGKGDDVAVASAGTLASLIERHQRARTRFGSSSKGRTLFAQPPRAIFSYVSYDAPPRRLHFELRLRESGKFAPRTLRLAGSLVASLRDAAMRRLQDALPDRAKEFERLIGGRGAGPRDIAQRVRIVPIPSIGMEHTDPSIRRIMVELPSACPFRSQDIKWAFAGLPAGPATEERSDECLVSTSDAAIANRFSRPARVFRSITAVALSSTGGREVGRAADATRRRRNEAKAAAAVAQALRHAHVKEKPVDIHVQREPFHRRGRLAAEFSTGTRFSSDAMWHVELRFASDVAGPLVIGDGRFCGLGLMEPRATHDDHDDIVAFDLPENSIALEHYGRLNLALRRALMSCARDDDGAVGTLFSGHVPDGGPDRAIHHNHVFIAADSDDARWMSRLIVAAPWVVDRHRKHVKKQERSHFMDVVYRLTALRAGDLGTIQCRAAPLDDADALVRPALCWESRTNYSATRNLKKRDDVTALLKEDVALECHRRGLPTPVSVELGDVEVGPKGGRPRARVKLRFATAVRGPILLGRDSHSGGGLFHA